MSYKTIILILLFINFQIDSLAQDPSDSLLVQLYSEIDSIVAEAIHKEAFPGCIIYASSGDSALFMKAYGYHRYDSLRPVSTSDIYDLASLTKITAATLAVMKLYDDGLLDLDAPVNTYIKGLGNSAFGKATLRRALAHQAGYTSWIKYYDKVKRRNGIYKRKTLTNEYSEKYPYQVSDELYLHRDFYKKIKRYIKKSAVSSEPTYLYSGLLFYLIPEMVEQVSGLEFQNFLNVHFYDPMGANSLVFNPLDHFTLDEIAPTEIDTFFRQKPLHGVVHDEGAILMRGVSGNAGLFARAEDLAKVWQMFAKRGVFQGDTLLHPATVDVFTSYQFPALDNRRGLGFDKPFLKYDSIKSTAARSASYESYGHTGYTGTMAWADPTKDLVFIFLSNRVYPNRSYRMLYEMRVRPAIQQLFYDYLEERKKCTYKDENNVDNSEWGAP